MQKLSIGGITFDANAFLAPMAGYTDKVYRSICLKQGAALAYTEMVSAEGLARNSANTEALMARGDGERILAVQLFMPDADTASRCVPNLMKAKPDLIDINCGCPVPKVVKTGAGSALLKKPSVIHDIVKVLISETGLPVTVKIRTGWDKESINYLETAEAAFSAGASALCMHARTRSQLYLPSAEWEHLAKLKASFCDKVIIGSGDLFTADDGRRMMEQTGIDAVAFARGAIGNPFIFRQFNEDWTPSPKEIADMAALHLDGLIGLYGERTACREMRKHICAYVKGIRGGSKIRQEANKAECRADYLKALSVLSPELVHQDSSCN